MNYYFYIKKYFPKSFVRVEKKWKFIYQLKLNECDGGCVSEDEESKKQELFLEEYQKVYDIEERNQINQISLIYNLD